jgi:hypothetical protein
MDEFELKLSGGEAELGRVAAADVARLILGAERVLARAAGHARGRVLAKTGRRGRVIEEAIRLRLVGVYGGSVRVVLAPPEPPSELITLGLDAATLTDESIRMAADVLTRPREPAYRDVARELVRLGDSIALGTRYEALSISHRGVQSVPAHLTATVAEHLRVATNLPIPTREDEVVGRLVEADFEHHTAHLRTVSGDRIEVRFDPEWEDLIQEALRQEASIAGEVAYDPATALAKSVHLRRLTQAEQLHAGLHPGEFRHTIAVQELASQAGIQPIEDGSQLAIDAPEDEVDRFMAALGING